MLTSSPLQRILSAYRQAAVSEREKGTYFEELIRTYLRHEPTYADLYSDVWLLSEVPDKFGINKQDVGIDLVARTRGTGEFHAIQCKFYAEDHRIQKSDIDSFFTASGQKPFTHRLIVTTTNEWGDNAEAALIDQQPPVTRIDLIDLEQSQIDWSKYEPDRPPALKPKFEIRRHQTTTINKVLLGLKDADRGKLIMACGTGKTFTSLKIAEEVAGEGKRVLFLVPSLALLSQTLTEWTQQSRTPLHSFAVCSDAEVGKKRRKSNEDVVQTFVHELRYPATTDPERLAAEMKKRHDARHMSVVFSTYHSIQVVSEAQHLHKLPRFDLVICDEAHRTTGATFESDTESAFVRVHDSDFLRGRKRLYMTATPRIYADIAKAKAIQQNAELCSMDDKGLYGEELHVITFSEAVERGLLTDYKVIVLTIDEDHVSERLQDLLKDDNNQLKVDDAARIVGCWKALSKQGLAEEIGDDTRPMRKAVAFCQVIEPTTGKKQHKVSSKQISELFQTVIDAYRETAGDDVKTLRCEAAHVDGTMNATEKESRINWLKDQADDNTCRILSNVRCLSEGVDVPALDAVLFLSPRSSQVDVVQSVGRVMRNAPGKKLGYVILPVVIPHGMAPDEALNDNKVYKVVWEVLQALRSHDDRFDAFVNKLDLIEKAPDKMEVIAITDTLSPKSTGKSDKPSGKGEFDLADETSVPREVQRRLQFDVGELERALYARLVRKCGNRRHWDDWANDIAKIAQTHIGRISTILNNPKNSREKAAFDKFAGELRDDLNDSVTDDEVIEMLAQHLITKPVFDALFADYSFASHNPVSQGMQNILDLLHEHHLEKEADNLEQFYASVRRRAEGIDNIKGKQKLVVWLYETFFKSAFPRMTDRLGIVYTPVEVVDFIIHSVNDILQEEFGQTLGSEGVHILDPFVGTGTFITRLLQSGLITPEQLPDKYKREIHCNEIVLLAYYIAAINIEAVYHGIVGGKYQPFDGICLTDTFQMYESDDNFERFFPDNSKRRKRQKKLDIRVIVGNPPYSVGQESADDDNQNVKYTVLDERIRATYGANTDSTLQRNLYDSYVRSLRWASDRIGTDGVIGFVTNSSFLNRQSLSGIRHWLSREFSTIHVFNLRGDQRGDWRKEGGKVFGEGSMAGIAVTVLTKSSKKNDNVIYYRDIGQGLSRESKLELIDNFGSVRGIDNADGWRRVVPDQFDDWLVQRDVGFLQHPALGSKSGDGDDAIFSLFSLGVLTSRDVWCYSFSETSLRSCVSTLVDFYEDERSRIASLGLSGRDAKEAVRIDSQRMKWSRKLKGRLAAGSTLEFSGEQLRVAAYRPFCKAWLYVCDDLNESPGHNTRLFPEPDSENRVICCTAAGNRVGFSTLICSEIPDIHMVDASGGNQCFPLHIYEPDEPETGLFATSNDSVESVRRDGITDAALVRFQTAYSGQRGCNAVNKEDIFYYIYGLLHSPDYRERYQDNLSKELPRIPAVKKIKDFQAFSRAGRDLAHWHLDYETVDCHPATLEINAPTSGSPKRKRATKGGPAAPVAKASGCAQLRKSHGLTDEQFYVRKMKFGPGMDAVTGKRIKDRTTVIYNDYITVCDIPLEAYDYVVNGKSAIEWVMERQAVTTDKKSGIVNDANLWATETMHNAAYPLELLLRVITVSIKTMEIVNELPELEIGE